MHAITENGLEVNYFFYRKNMQFLAPNMSTFLFQQQTGKTETADTHCVFKELKGTEMESWQLKLQETVLKAI